MTQDQQGLAATYITVQLERAIAADPCTSYLLQYEPKLGNEQKAERKYVRALFGKRGADIRVIRDVTPLNEYGEYMKISADAELTADHCRMFARRLFQGAKKTNAELWKFGGGVFFGTAEAITNFTPNPYKDIATVAWRCFGFDSKPKDYVDDDAHQYKPVDDWMACSPEVAQPRGYVPSPEFGTDQI